MPSEQILQFNSEGYRLTGTLHLPDLQNPYVVIGCHGLLANRHSLKQISLAKACNRLGIAYFRFDHRGCGDSEGRFNEVTSLQARVQDLSDAIGTIQRQPHLNSITALFGSSFGGTVILKYGSKNTGLSLITYAAPINSSTIHHVNIRDNKGQSPSSDLLTNALEFDITQDLISISNIFVAHSQGDETVPVKHAEEIYRRSGDPKKLLIFEEGDHQMSNASHQLEFEDQFGRWITLANK